MLIKKAISFAVLVSVMSSCASMFNKDYQQVNVVTSNGKKAELSIDGKTISAPAIVDVKRSEKSLIVTGKGKCAGQTIANSKISNVFWINLLSSGPFGSTTDYATEKMWQYDDRIEVSCED